MMTTTNDPTGIINLITIMAKLRSATGCPWDKEQTPESLKPFILEEAYELLEAIDTNNSNDICDELGDVLLQVIFISQMFKEKNIFTIADVTKAISNKLVRRHPHVFGNECASNHTENWNKIKLLERSTKGKGNKLVDRIPNNLPALKKATKVAKKINSTDKAIDIGKINGTLQKLSLVITTPQNCQKDVGETFGELLFEIVQLANSLQLDSEDILRKKTLDVMNEIDTQKIVK